MGAADAAYRIHAGTKHENERTEMSADHAA